MKSLFNLLSVLLVTLFVTNLSAQIQYTRANNQDGLHVFEPSKKDMTEYTGFKLHIGGAFTQGYQNLSHENSDTITVVARKLYTI